MSIKSLVNEHILNLIPYSSARDDFSGEADIYLDANESWYEGQIKANRYPDPRASLLRRKIEEVLSLPYKNTLIGNGSDEIIDLMIRIFCKPGEDRIMIMRPTYGAYRVFADINNVETISLLENSDLTLDEESIIEAIERYRPKIVFICSPNNPTGKSVPLSLIRRIAESNKGITAVDEAYSDFAPAFESAVTLLEENERVVVIRTLSKAWALAGARVGILVASEEIIALFDKAKAPYNVSILAQRAAFEALSDRENIERAKEETLKEKRLLEKELGELEYVKEVIAGDANFVLLRVDDAKRLYNYLSSKGIIVRSRDSEPHLKGCLRITVGSKIENRALMGALSEYKA